MTWRCVQSTDDGALPPVVDALVCSGWNGSKKFINANGDLLDQFWNLLVQWGQERDAQDKRKLACEVDRYITRIMPDKRYYPLARTVGYVEVRKSPPPLLEDVAISIDPHESDHVAWALDDTNFGKPKIKVQFASTPDDSVYWVACKRRCRLGPNS